MGLLDGIEKLITEHGSAANLRERIALAREQYAALERSAAELRKDNDRLKSANAELQVRVRELERQQPEVPSGT
jgi:phage shock protein A